MQHMHSMLFKTKTKKMNHGTPDAYCTHHRRRKPSIGNEVSKEYGPQLSQISRRVSYFFTLFATFEENMR